MNSATKAHDYEQRITKDHTLGLNNCDNVMGNDAFLLNRMKVSTEIRRSQNPLDAVQNIRGYDAQGNKILINQEAIQSGFLSDQGTNYEMIGSTKKSINRMFDRQFENQAVFLNQSYNPHINQMRPADPRDENLREKDELKNNYPGQTQIFSSPTSYNPFSPTSTPFLQNQNQNREQETQQTCPYCKSTKHIPFLNDGGSVLICQNCQKTFSNIYYNTGSPWFSDKFKAENASDKNVFSGSDKNVLSEFQFSPRKKVSNVANFTNTQNAQNAQNAHNLSNFSNAPERLTTTPSYDSTFRNNRPAQGMRGEGNYSSESNVPKNPMQNNYADHANSQLQSYRAKFDFDHHSSRV